MSACLSVERHVPTPLAVTLGTYAGPRQGSSSPSARPFGPYCFIAKDPGSWRTPDPSRYWGWVPPLLDQLVYGLDSGLSAPQPPVQRPDVPQHGQAGAVTEHLVRAME